MNPTPTLVLDLDGTLIDTAGDLIATLNVVLDKEGLPPAPFDKARSMIGFGARAMLETALTAHGAATPPERIERLFADFLVYYSDHIADYSRPFPGVEAALDRFADAGWRLAVCTNKLEALARELLTRLRLADRFAIIAGRDTFATHKPDPCHLLETIARSGGIPTASVMVGDSKVDIDTAIAADIPIIAVTFGYSPQPIAQLGAHHLIDHFDQLFDVAHATQQG